MDYPKSAKMNKSRKMIMVWIIVNSHIKKLLNFSIGGGRVPLSIGRVPLSIGWVKLSYCPSNGQAFKNRFDKGLARMASSACARECVGVCVDGLESVQSRIRAYVG